MTESAPVDVSKASAASSKLQLHHIALFSVEAQGHRLPERVNLNFEIGHRETVWNVIADSLVCVFGLDVTILAMGTEPPTTLASLAVCFRVEYKMHESYNPATDEELLPHYAGVVGRLHVWPYMRAEIQELTGKLGLPPLTLPILLAGGTVGLPVRKLAAPPIVEGLSFPKPSVPHKKVAKRTAKAKPKSTHPTGSKVRATKSKA